MKEVSCRTNSSVFRIARYVSQVKANPKTGGFLFYCLIVAASIISCTGFHLKTYFQSLDFHSKLWCRAKELKNFTLLTYGKL